MYQPCNKNHYWDGFTDEHDIIVFDEFQGKHIDFGLLKLILDGSEQIKLPCRYADVIKITNVPVIICNNFSPCDVYSKLFHKYPVCLEEFMDRIEFIDLSLFHENLYIFKHPF